MQAAERHDRLGHVLEAGIARLVQLLTHPTPVISGARKSERGLDGLATRIQQRKWDKRASRWDHHGAPGLAQVVETILDGVCAEEGAIAVDLGCGTGQLSLPLAGRGAHVTAVDVSPAMIARLMEKARENDITRVDGVVSPIEAFDLPPGTVDLVVSNYALHHLHDRDKQALLRSVTRWLRGGGRLVVGDMMFGRGASSRDRAIIIDKVVRLAKRGPGGWWRLAKNLCRFTFRLQERPVSLETWCRLFEEAGFIEISVVTVVSEAAVITGTKP